MIEPEAQAPVERVTELRAPVPPCPFCRRHTWFQTWRITGGKGYTWLRPTGVTVDPRYTRDTIRNWQCSGCYAEAPGEIAQQLDVLAAGHR